MNTPVPPPPNRVERPIHPTSEVLLKCLPVGVLVQNSLGEITTANPAAEKILGLSLAEMRGATSTDPRWGAIHDDGSPFPGSEHPAMVTLQTGVAMQNVIMGVFNPSRNAYIWIRIETVPIQNQDIPGQINGVCSIFEDITGQKVAEDALRVTSQQLSVEGELLHLFIEHAPVALAMFDRDMRYLGASHRWRKDYGLDQEDLLGLSHYELFPEIPERWKQLQQRTLAGEKLRSEDYSFYGPNGELYWNHWEMHPWRTYDGKIGGIVVFTEDISERKNAEAALKESEEKFRLAFDNANTGMCLVDLDGRLLKVNAKMSAIFGYSQSELEAMNVNDLALPEDHELSPQFIENAIEGTGDSTSFSKRYRHRNGQIVYGEVASSLVRDANGEPAYFISQVQDISRRRQAEADILALHADLEKRVKERTQELAKAEERFRLAMEASRDGLWDWHLPSGYTYFSPGYAIMLGFDPDEFAPHVNTWISLLHPDERDGVLAETEQLLHGDGYYEFEFQLRCRDGSYRWILSRGKTIEYGSSGKPIRAIGTHQDITERKRAKAALDSAKRAAESANEAKSRFLANMSHEIRTPLNGILGLAHIMRRGNLNTDQIDYLDKIDAAGQHLQVIIDDILNLSKIEAGMLVLTEEDFLLTDVLHTALGGLSDPVKAKGLDLVVEMEGVPETLRGDITRLNQALMNYLGNAVKFTEKGRINLKGEVLESTGTDYLIRFTVSDTGPGLSPQQQASLFAPFVQIDDSLRRKHGGTGLGLAITRRLAELMGGTAGVESSEGLGSQFWFTARLRPAKHLIVEKNVDSNALDLLRQKHAGTRILLVEDDAINQEIVIFLLEDAGLVAIVADNGLQALAKLEVEEFPLILMDMQMPEMDGLEATRRIRKQPQHLKTPILALTANAFAEDRNACLAAGMNDYLVKPMEPDILYEKLLEWLGKAA